MKTNLQNLLDRINAGEFDEREMTNLPTFGGSEPMDTTAVWSWDKTHLIVGDSDFQIVKRCECGEAPHNCKHDN